MKYCLLGQLVWLGCYAVLFVFAGALLHFVLVLGRAVRSRSELAGSWRKPVLRSSLGLMATAVCFAFFYESMFVRFSCMEVASDTITLGYFWPKPSHVIALSALTGIEVERDRKQRGELVVSSKDREDRSIVCPKGGNLEDAHKAIAALLQSKGTTK